ncbi:MAG: ABC transporter ATP-binding protein [Leptospirales bacterium]|nr:ABC transporter ATP-binding protein [Leptospirales bacterium]
MNEESAIIVARGVARRYGQMAALSGVDLQIAEGEFVALMGESGSGKTTLLNLIAGLDRCDDGLLRVAGEEPASYNAAQLASFRRRVSAVVFQDSGLLPALSAEQNASLPLRLRGERPQRARLLQLFARVGLAGKEARLPEELSGGEQQRVAIVRALALHPRILAADEPTGALDSSNARAALTLLQQLNRELGLTIVMATHSDRAAAVADRILRLSDGRIVA